MTAVPYKTEYWANMVEWAGYLAEWFVNKGIDEAATTPGSPEQYDAWDAALAQSYYDGQLCAYYVQDHLGDNSLATWIANERKAYVDWYLDKYNVLGGATAYRAFSEGLLQDVLRGTAKSSDSIAQINRMLTAISYATSDGTGDDALTRSALSRETAYMLMLHINATRAGITLDSTQLTRQSHLLDLALSHIDDWVNETAEFYRPFMGSITSHALIHYYLYVAEDSRILPALESLATYTWTFWKDSAGGWGQANSFLYTNTVGEDGIDWWASSEDANTTPDLNMMIAPTFGFLWWQTGVQDWRDKGDAIFAGSISNYEPVIDGGFYNSGAYLGYRSSSNPNGKQYDQQLVWGPLYIEWAESTPVGTNTSTYIPGATLTGTLATGFKGIIEYGTDYTPAQYADQTTFDRAQGCPLDGSVIKILTNSGIEFSTRAWGVDRWNLSDLSTSVRHLTTRNQLGWGRIRKNFAKLQIANRTDTVVDWFSTDVEILIHNMDVLGKFVAKTGLTGIWFDNEGYLPVWTYNSMANKATYTLAEYQAQVYKVAKLIGTKWRAASPSLNVMVINAYDGYVGRLPNIAGSEWGLWKDFLDGLLDGYGETLTTNFKVSPRGGFVGIAATGKIILTTEGTYRLDNIPNIIRYGVRQMNGTYDSYTRPGSPPNDLGDPPCDIRYWGGSPYFYNPDVTEIGLALWIDAPWPISGDVFNPSTPTDNMWTPTSFIDGLSHIMEACQWVWIYDPAYRFYDPNGTNEIPAAYKTPMATTRASYGLL